MASCVDSMIRSRTNITFDRTDGEHNPLAKMTQQQAEWVRQSAARGVSQNELAALMGVSISSIRSIVTNKSYRNEKR